MLILELELQHPCYTWTRTSVFTTAASSFVAPYILLFVCVCVFCRTSIVLGMHWESFGDALKVLSRSIRDALGLLFECVGNAFRTHLRLHWVYSWDAFWMHWECVSDAFENALGMLLGCFWDVLRLHCKWICDALGMLWFCIWYAFFELFGACFQSCFDVMTFEYRGLFLVHLCIRLSQDHESFEARTTF